MTFFWYYTLLAAAQKGYLVPNIFWSRYFFYFWPLYSNKKKFDFNLWDKHMGWCLSKCTFFLFHSILWSVVLDKVCMYYLFPVSEFVLKKILWNASFVLCFILFYTYLTLSIMNVNIGQWKTERFSHIISTKYVKRSVTLELFIEHKT